MGELKTIDGPGLLAAISKVKTQLATTSKLSDVLDIRDKAEALRTYAKAAGMHLETQNAAAEAKLRAERRAGQLLAGMEKHNGDPRLHDVTRLEDCGVTKMQSFRWQKEASVTDDEFDEFVNECNIEGKELTQSALLKLANAGHVSQASGENEWYTPAAYLEMAREALGGFIDLDPASSDVAQKNVKAGCYYTIADDGLSKRWFGNVWMNPPYSKDLISRFTERLRVAYEDGQINQAIVLVNNATETGWFQKLASVSSAFCFLAGRIKFLNKTGEVANSPLQGQVFVYLGANPQKFVEVFSGVGFICETSRPVLTVTSVAS